MKASHKEHEQLVGLQKITLQPGQFIYGRMKASKELKIKESTVNKYMCWLKDDEIINIKSNNKFSVITIVNWALYQFKNEDSDSKSNSNVTTKEQQRNTNKNVKNVKNVYKEYSSEIIRMADRLKFLILQNNPGAKTPTDLTKWQSDFDKMKRLDNRTDEQIYAVMEFSQKDSFWKSNILSAGKLREKFDTLLLQKDRPKPQQKTGPVNKANFNQRKYTNEEIEKMYTVL